MILFVIGYFFGLIYITNASWPLYIDAVIFGLCMLLSVPSALYLYKASEIEGTLLAKALVGAMAGALGYIMVFFMSDLVYVKLLSYFLSLIFGAVASFIPCGHSLSLFAAKAAGLIPLMPHWVSAVTLVFDLIGIVFYILVFVMAKKELQTAKMRALREEELKRETAKLLENAARHHNYDYANSSTEQPAISKTSQETPSVQQYNVSRPVQNTPIQSNFTPLHSEVNGNVSFIAVSERTPVKKGDLLAVISMTAGACTVSSPLNGKVRNIKIKNGDNVRIGSLLMVIEKE